MYVCIRPDFFNVGVGEAKGRKKKSETPRMYEPDGGRRDIVGLLIVLFFFHVRN